jgi:hypothetical protein
MVCQISLFVLKPGVSADRLEEMMWTTRTSLLRIREILNLNVGKRIRPEDPWDWFVSIEVESLAKLAIAMDDPHYRKFMDDVLDRDVQKDKQQVVAFEMEPRKDVKYS